MSANSRAVIALDWGTSNLRAFRLGEGGEILEQRERPWGIMSLPVAADAGGFDRALEGIAGDWLEATPQAKLVASGMVGSAQGWLEAPYLDCPAGAEALAARMAPVRTASGRRLLIVPGLLQNRPDELPDVIRGEETQVIGALADDKAHRADQSSAAGPICFVLPGTHSKWVLVANGRIERFATYMTGELYGVLKQHSILGRLMHSPPEVMSAADAQAESAAAFGQALTLARGSQPGELMRQLFTVRSMKLAGRLPSAALADYLSGLLIGHELVSATASLAREAGAAVPIVLIGEAALIERYLTAFAAFNLPVGSRSNTAAAGLYRLACLARL